MNEENEKKLINLLEKIESHLAKMVEQKASNAIAIIPIGDHVEADLKIQSPAREWKNGNGWFYDAELELNGGKTSISFAVNKKVHNEEFRQGDVLFVSLEKGKPSKRGEDVFWLSRLIGLGGAPVPKSDPFENREPREKPTWQIGSEEPPPF